MESIQKNEDALIEMCAWFSQNLNLSLENENHLLSLLLEKLAALGKYTLWNKANSDENDFTGFGDIILGLLREGFFHQLIFKAARLIEQPPRKLGNHWLPHFEGIVNMCKPLRFYNRLKEIDDFSAVEAYFEEQTHTFPFDLLRLTWCHPYRKTWGLWMPKGFAANMK